jgi:hypothetical protein
VSPTAYIALNAVGGAPAGGSAWAGAQADVFALGTDQGNFVAWQLGSDPARKVYPSTYTMMDIATAKLASGAVGGYMVGSMGNGTSTVYRLR